MYRVKLYHLRRNVKFVIMNSVYYTDKSIQTFYDLKGSEIGRAAKPGQDVLKDNDLRNSLPEDAFSFSPNRRARLRTQVESDCNFLRKMQIMDYSMLIGVHHIPPSKVDQRNNIGETGFKIQDRRSHRKQNSKGNVNDVDTDASAKTHRSIGSDPVASLGSTIDNIPKEKQSYQDAAPDSNVNGDSTKRLIKDIRESAYSASNYEFAGLLEDEDDCSYLEGSENHNEQYARKLHAYQQHPKYDDVEMKKEQTIEQIYWPFHKFYDINGYRRMKPKECYICQKYPCVCEGVSDLVKAWKIPEFIPPLSDRKDGGFMLDTTDTHIPMVYHGEQEDMNYEGKIYFMGIIDILQQYNARKRVETRYRKIEVRGKAEPSCVSPDDYASRFILFFDEYSGKAHTRRNGEEKSNGVEITKNGAHVVSVVSHDKNTTTATNGSVASAKITPDVSTNNDTHKVEGIVGRPVALKPGEKPQGKYVVI
jgi:1-phosphatidylinositol-4-phosphate 5-kinase